MPKQILLAFDGGQGSDRVVDRTLQLAKQWSAKLTILHVTGSKPADEPDPGRRSRSAHDAIVSDIAGHALARDVEIDVEAMSGNKADLILSRSAMTGADLIVMGFVQHGSLVQKLLGSTVQQVLRNATAPVLSVKSSAFHAYEKILVVTDFSPASASALDAALRFFPGQSITLLNVHDVIQTVLPEAKLEELTAGLTSRLTEAVGDALSRNQEGRRESLPNLATMLAFGAPVDAIVHHVAEHRPDLVVMGTQGRTGLQRALIGSVAEKLLRLLPCDVVAVNAKVSTREP